MSKVQNKENKLIQEQDLNPKPECYNSEDMFKTVHDYSNENDVKQILDIHLKG